MRVWRRRGLWQGSSVGPPVTSLCHSYIQSPTVFTFTQDTHKPHTLKAARCEKQRLWHTSGTACVAWGWLLCFLWLAPNLPRLDSFDCMEFVHRPQTFCLKRLQDDVACFVDDLSHQPVRWKKKKKKTANVSHGKIKIAPWWTLFKELCKLPMQVSSCKCKRMSSHLFEFGFLVPWVNPAMSSVPWLSQYHDTSAFHVELMSWSDAAWRELEKRKWLVGFCSPIPSVTFSFSVWPPPKPCANMQLLFVIKWVYCHTNVM